MYCEKCGKELSNEAVFCEKCGVRVKTEAAEPVVTEAGATSHANEINLERIIDRFKNDKKLQRISAILCGAAVLAIIVISIVSRMANTVNIADYIVISDVTGVNGYGTVSYEIDEMMLCFDVFEELEDQISDAMSEEDELYDLFSDTSDVLELRYATKIEALTDSITIKKVENNGSLTNGDTVEIEVTFDSERTSIDFGKRIVGGTFTYTVFGLDDGINIDVFDPKYTTVEFGGVNGYGSVEFSKTNLESWQYYMNITIDKTGQLSNGDKITLTAEMSDENYQSCFSQMLKRGYILPQTATKEYEVTGLKDGETVDIFDSKYITVKFEGIDGFGKIVWEETDIESWQYGMDITADKTENLSNGDKIILTAEMSDNNYKNYFTQGIEEGYILPQNATKEYTVSGLTKMATAEDISADVIEQAKEDALEYFNTDLKDHDREYSDIEVIGVYFKDKNDKNEPYSDNQWAGNTFVGIRYYNTLNVIINYKVNSSSKTQNLIFCDLELNENGELLPIPFPKEEGYDGDGGVSEVSIYNNFFDDTDNYTITKLD